MTTWIQVEDPTTLKASDKIRIEFASGGFLEDTILEPGSGSMLFEGLGYWDMDSEYEKWFVGAAPFAAISRYPNPGEIFEGNDGMRYTLNPLNPALIIQHNQGYSALDLQGTLVRTLVVH